MNMTAATRREIAALLLILAAGLLLAGWYHTRGDTTPRDTYRVVAHTWQGEEELGDMACTRTVTAKGPQMLCVGVDPASLVCLPPKPGFDFVACGAPTDNTLSEPEKWSR